LLIFQNQQSGRTFSSICQAFFRIFLQKNTPYPYMDTRYSSCHLNLMTLSLLADPFVSLPIRNCAAEDKDCLCSIPRCKEAASAASVVVSDGVFQLLAADPEVFGLAVQAEIAGSGKTEELSVEGNLV
jgi:hypothetical protein